MFVDELIETHSTYTSRTMMSAQLVLAGMWPPNEVQRWNPKLNWQPIPVHYKQKGREDVISPSICTYRTLKLLQQPKIPEIQTKFIKPYKKIYNYIKHHSGFQVSDPATAIEFFFIVNTEV
ncbi:acid phosphatase-related [Holotrichia oblita]|uniref:Acid phosphatase-related n=2 Tax=Holotrichia oblita TaxID=644536 RepID=A0ACB9SYH8_HOLOL|nr:acid phosphatase-related [Holotrichia oblita]KAI4459630.1 acid phosphatase-related [Holotrichia oblita]